MKLFSILFFCLVMLFFTACSTRGHKVYNQHKKPIELIPIDTNTNYKTKVLFSEYEKWKGTPYRLGGVSLNGVDCSSFIQQVYYDAFCLRIPRTTIKQLKVGHEIDKSQLRAGDMIFFKTGWDVRHVGIIVEDGAFMHASTSSGVTISSIHNPYWRSNYFKSVRILP